MKLVSLVKTEYFGGTFSPTEPQSCYSVGPTYCMSKELTRQADSHRLYTDQPVIRPPCNSSISSRLRGAGFGPFTIQIV